MQDKCTRLMIINIFSSFKGQFGMVCCLLHSS